VGLTTILVALNEECSLLSVASCALECMSNSNDHAM